jgi:hypothetical protein
MKIVARKKAKGTRREPGGGGKSAAGRFAEGAGDRRLHGRLNSRYQRGLYHKAPPPVNLAKPGPGLTVGSAEEIMWGNRMSRENELMSRVGASGPAQRDWAVIIGLSLGALVFHLLVNTFGGYGIFRDEYYYIACSKRLAAGYVDQPPLAMFLLAASRAVFGLSELGLRVLPALAHGLTVLLAGLIARNLGGRRTAVMLTCVAVSLTPLIVGHTNIFQMNAFAHL